VSGFLAGKVWQSALAPHLKPLAAALADIANDDGTSIYPSVAYMAWLLGRSERAIQNGLSDLRAQRILRVEGRGCGGKGHPTEYRLIESALPKRPPWKEHRQQKGETVAPFDQETAKPDSPFPREKGESVAPFEEERVRPVSSFRPAKGEALLQKGEAQLQKGAVSASKGCNFRQERVKPASPNPSVEPLVEPSGEPSQEPGCTARPNQRAFSDRAIEMFNLRFGQKPTWSAKDYRQLADLLRLRQDLTLAEFERRYAIMLASEDRFVGQKHGSLLYFCTRFDEFIEPVGGNGSHVSRARQRTLENIQAAREFLQGGIDASDAHHG
jgi:hypothetical protein